MDYNLYRAVNGLSGETFPDGVMKFLANDLPGILVVLVALTFLLPGRTGAQSAAAARF